MLSTPDLAHQPLSRVVVLVGDTLLEGDDGVVGDVDVDRADLGATLGYVAVPYAPPALLKPLVPHKGAGTGELGVLVVCAQHVADILAHKALDALLRLVEPLHILLVH